MTDSEFEVCDRVYAKMEAAYKDQWCTALRSGDYKQGFGHLRQSNGQDVFCCLGVLQDVVQPEDWEEPNDLLASKAWSVPESYDDGVNPSFNDGEIQERLMDETNFDSEAMHSLITMNDGEHPPGSEMSVPRINKKSFGEIADWIEKNL